jgi:drug/metabolite transporter (DMT)-like permease
VPDAGYLTTVRYAKLRRPDMPVLLLSPIASTFASIACLIYLLASAPPSTPERPTGVVAFAYVHGAFWPIVVFDAWCSAACYVFFANATKYITGAETGLVLLLEPLFVPFWVFIGFGEVPSVWTAAGGALLLLTLGAHEAHAAGKCVPRRSWRCDCRAATMQHGAPSPPAPSLQARALDAS